MKKIISLAIVFSLLLACFMMVIPVSASTSQNVSKWDGTVYDVAENGGVMFTFDGAGTETNPYLLNSADDVSKLAANARYDSSENFKGKYFKLTCDLDLQKHPWKGIGGCGNSADNVRFEGNFDGDGHVVYNLNLFDLGQNGFFGYVGNGAVIENLGIASGSSQFTARDRVGVLIGFAKFDVTVRNCFNRSNIKNTGNGYTGGLIGTIMNAQDTSTHTIEDCYNTGDITVTGVNTSYCVGGIVGYLSDGTNNITRCYQTGNISVTATNASIGTDIYKFAVGGLVGSIAWADRQANTFTDCGVAGSITYNNSNTSEKTAYVGTMAGFLRNGLQTFYSGTNAIAVKNVDMIGNGYAAEVDKITEVESVTVPIASGYEFFIKNIREESDTPYDDTVTDGGDDSQVVIGTVPSMTEGTHTDYVPMDDADRSRYEAASKWDGTVYHVTSDSEIFTFMGSGTKADPYLLQSADDVAKLAANVRYESETTTYWEKYFKLTCDIDLQHKEWWGIGGMRPDTAWNEKTMFSGYFQGDHHVIYNFNLADSDSGGNALHFVGFFGYVGIGTKIENLGIMNGDVYLNGSCRVGNLIGAAHYDLYVTNCFNRANLSLAYKDAGEARIGGLIGCAMNDDISVRYLTDCYNAGDVTVYADGISSHAVGGIIGFVNTCEITELDGCYNTGDIAVYANHGKIDSTEYKQIAIGSLLGSISYKGKYYIRDCGAGGTITYVNDTTNASKVIGAAVGCVVENCTLTFDGENQYSVAVEYDKAVGYGVGSFTMEKVSAIEVPVADGSAFIALPKSDGSQNQNKDPQDDQAPETQDHNSATETPTTDNSQSNSEKKSGCGSTIAGSGLVFLMIFGTCCSVKRKN